MRKINLYTLDTPYREPLTIWGYEFGRADAPKCVAVVGSMRGNEVEQTYVCADLVRRLSELEQKGAMDPGRRVLVVPSVNAFSMNIAKRFWPVDNTDINRMFPGYDLGETTQRIADGLFRAVQGYDYGIQLCSFYLPGDFQPHVRGTPDPSACSLSSSPRRSASPTSLQRSPRASTRRRSTTTGRCGGRTRSACSCATWGRSRPATPTRSRTASCGSSMTAGWCASRCPAASGRRTSTRRRSWTSGAGGFFLRDVEPGERVRTGQTLGQVLDTGDAHVKEMLTAPLDGRVFFCHVDPLINQYTIAFKLAPETTWSHSQ